MEGIQGARRQTLPPTQRMAPAEAKRTAVPSRTDTFQSVLTKEERAEQAAKTPDLPNFSKMTDRQKLSALATLHDATDYSGMTDVEKYKLMRDRFEAAFPYLGAYESELIGRDGTHYFGTANMPRPVKGTASLIQEEQSRQWESQGLKNISRLHREAYYSGMTDGEAARAIAGRQKGGCFAAQACVLQELKLCGLGDQEKIQKTLTHMRAQLVQWVTGARVITDPPILETDNATQEEELAALAMGRPPRNQQKSTDWGALKRTLDANADAWDQKVADNYSQYVQGVIDSIVDEIVKGEAGGEDASPVPPDRQANEAAEAAARK